MQVPRIEKITLNMGVGDAKQDSKILEAAQEQLAPDRRPEAERAPRPQVDRQLQAARGHAGRRRRHAARRARVRVPRSPDLDRDPAYPRLPRAARQVFDGRGNYSIGVREQIIFPEIDYDAVDQVRGLDIAITTSAKTDEEGYALLEMLGMPFAARAPEQTTARS